MKLTTLIAGFACALAASLSTSAQVLMLDFGPTVADGGSLTSSPYHSVTPGFTDPTWNTIGVNDVAASGLLWSNATPTTATGVSLSIGATSEATSRTINLATNPSNSSALGNTVNTGLYSGTSVITDGIFNGSTGNTRAVGVQIGGLTAGTYDVYISGRNTNTSATQTQNFYAGSGPASGTFTFATADSTTAANGYQTASITYANGTAGSTVWAPGSNYVKLTVTLTGSDVLNIAALGGTGESRGFLNMIQVVPIPESSTFAALAGAGSLLFAFTRRQRALR